MRGLLEGEAASRVLPKDKLAEALGYLRNHWNELQVYLGDGRVPIDNNETEQLMKQVALGRKLALYRQHCRWGASGRLDDVGKQRNAE